MRNRLIAVLVAFAAAFSAAPSVAAQGAATFSQAELRFTVFNGEAGEHHVWRLQPGGRATGVSHAFYNRGKAYVLDEVRDRGTWRLTGDTLCVTWQRLLHGGEHCFRLTVTGKRFTGAPTRSGRNITGTLTPLN